MTKGISGCLEGMARASFEAHKQDMILRVTRDVLGRLKTDKVLLAEHVESIRMVGVGMEFTIGGKEVRRVVDPALWPFWLDGGKLPEGAAMAGWLPEIIADGLKHVSGHETSGIFVVVQFEGGKSDERVPAELEWTIVSEAIGEAVGRLESWVAVLATEIAVGPDGCLVHGSEVNAKLLAAEFARILRALAAERAAETDRSDDFAPAIAEELIALGIEKPTEADLYIIGAVPKIYEAKLEQQ